MSRVGGQCAQMTGHSVSCLDWSVSESSPKIGVGGKVQNCIQMVRCKGLGHLSSKGLPS